jgi:peptidoglycan hydrolase-like protein with peptidoglycan-binding domain
MTTHRLALGKRATSITTFAALLIVAGLAMAPTSAHAASRRPAPELAQGAGMGAKPSVRVREVQLGLTHRGFDLGRPGVDGRFGPLTAAAVRQMQAVHGLAVDGIVGAHTRKALGLTRHAVDTQRRSHAEHRSKTVRERRPTAAHAARHRATAAVTTVRDASTEPSSRDDSWLGSLLAGALGGLMTVLVATAVAARRRHRDREPSTTTPSPPLLADELDPRSDERRAVRLA